MKKYFFLLLAFTLLFSGCAKAPPKNTDTIADEGESANGEYTFNAVIKSIDESGVLVEVCEGEDLLRSSDQITFSHKDLDDIIAEVGDTVTVTYNGVVMESYPAQITALSWSIFKKHIPTTSINPHARFNVDDLEEDFILAEYSYEDVYMSAKLPTWWEYETIPYGSEAMSREFDNGFGLRFWDESTPDLSFSLLYREDPVGLCGTDLTSSRITLQNGKTASAAMYGGSIFLVSFAETGVRYSVFASGSVDEDPWKIYEDEIMAIIKTIELGGDL